MYAFPPLLFIVLQVYMPMLDLHCSGGSDSDCYYRHEIRRSGGVEGLSHGGCSATPSLFHSLRINCCSSSSLFHHTENIMATPANATSVVDAQYVHLLLFTTDDKEKERLMGSCALFISSQSTGPSKNTSVNLCT